MNDKSKTVIAIVLVGIIVMKLLPQLFPNSTRRN